MTGVETDLSRILEDFDRRIHTVEQIATSPAVMGGGSGGGSGGEYDYIVIGGVVINATPPDPVTDVTAEVGAFFDNIFADIEWVEATTGGDAVTFDVELAEKTGTVYELMNTFSTAGTGGRFNNLKPNQTYGVRIIPVNRIGIRSVSTPAWTDFTTGIDSTVPPAPTNVILARGATTVVVKFTPLTSTEARDVANGHGLYEIEIDTSTAFNTPNLRQMRSGDQVVAFNDVLTEGSWVARVRAVDSSGNVGPWSATSSALTAGGVNDSMLIADISAAKITAGFLSASRLQAGTITADKLTTSDLTTANITMNGGSFKAGNPPTTGILFNSQGIRGYKAGDPTFIMDAATGDALFKGTVQGSIVMGSKYVTTPTLSGAARLELDDYDELNGTEMGEYGGMLNWFSPGNNFYASIAGQIDSVTGNYGLRIMTGSSAVTDPFFGASTDPHSTFCSIDLNAPITGASEIFMNGDKITANADEFRVSDWMFGSTVGLSFDTSVFIRDGLALNQPPSGHTLQVSGTTEMVGLLTGTGATFNDAFAASGPVFIGLNTPTEYVAVGGDLYVNGALHLASGQVFSKTITGEGTRRFLYIN